MVQPRVGSVMVVGGGWDADRVGSGEKILRQCRLVATLNSLTYNVLWVMN